MIPLRKLRKDDPLNELAAILFSFMDDGFIKTMALRYFEGNKPRVRATIKRHKRQLLDLIEAIE